MNYVSLGYVELSKTLFHYSGDWRFLKYATLRTTTTTLKNHLSIRERKPYLKFSAFLT